MLRTIFSLKTKSEVKVKLGQRSEVKVSDPKMVRDNPLSQDASTHQIWYAYLTLYKRYSSDSMRIKESRSEVKVTVTQLRYSTLRHPKIHQHTKFVIPTSNNIKDMFPT